MGSNFEAVNTKQIQLREILALEAYMYLKILVFHHPNAEYSNLTPQKKTHFKKEK